MKKARRRLQRFLPFRCEKLYLPACLPGSARAAPAMFLFIYMCVCGFSAANVLSCNYLVCHSAHMCAEKNIRIVSLCAFLYNHFSGGASKKLFDLMIPLNLGRV